MRKEIIQIQLQLALFFQSDFVGNFENFSLKLKTKLGESKITQHIPVPVDAPSEIPRLVLGYEKFNINVSKNRLDLFSKDFELIKTIVSDVSDVLLDKLSLSVGRIGFVKNYFIDGTIEDLKKLLPEEKIRRLNLKEINIRINNRKQIEKYECNNIENLSNRYIVKKEIDGNEVKRAGIIILRDINTLAEKLNENRFNKEEVNKLINVFNKESNNFIIYSND